MEMKHETDRELNGCVEFIASGEFTMHITNPAYTAAEVVKLLQEDEMRFGFRDTVLQDDGGEEVATIEWHLYEQDTTLLSFSEEEHAC